MIQPKRGHVLIRIKEFAKEQNGILVIHNKFKDEEPILFAEVVSVGPGVDQAETGDEVLIRGYAGKWVDKDIFGDEFTYRIMEEDELLARIDRKVTA